MKKQIVYFDVLNILACLCVIGLHCNGIVHELPAQNAAAWQQSLVIEALAYWAVPVFLMLSGATTLNYRSRYSTKDFLRRRFVKILIPLTFWSAAYYGARLLLGRAQWQGFRMFIAKIMNFDFVGVYWFFAPLILIYLAMPVLSLLSDNKRLLRYSIVTLIITGSLLPFAASALSIPYNSGFSLFSGYGSYLLLPLIGYYLHNCELKPWQRAVIYVLGISGAATRFFFTLNTAPETNSISNLTAGYTNIPTLAYAAAIFVFIKYLCRMPLFSSEKLAHLLRFFASASFGIYLIHIFVMELILHFLNADVYSAVWRLLAPPLIWLVSFAIVKIISRLPYGKYLFP